MIEKKVAALSERIDAYGDLSTSISMTGA